MGNTKLSTLIAESMKMTESRNKGLQLLIGDPIHESMNNYKDTMWLRINGEIFKQFGFKEIKPMIIANSIVGLHDKKLN